MRLLIAQYDIEITMEDHLPVCLCIESPTLYRDIVNSLWKHVNYGNEEIYLSKEGESLNFNKKADLIINPFSVSCNDKRLTARLFQDISRIANEDYYEDADRINAQLINFFDNIIHKIPYRIDYELEFDITSLAKAYKIRFEDDQDLIPRLLSYIKLMHNVCGIECFIFNNLKQIMTKKELSFFYKDIIYEQVNVLDIEGLYCYRVEEEACIIIDKDKCLITID